MTRTKFPPAPMLTYASAICQEIQKISNLHAVIPVWSDGCHINMITLEVHHGRLETIGRGHADFIDKRWEVSDATDDVVEVFYRAAACHNFPT